MLSIFINWVEEVYEALHGSTAILDIFEKFGDMFEVLLENVLFLSLTMTVQTIAVTICLIYFILEVMDKLSDKMLSLEQFVTLLLRLIIAYLLITNCVPILKGFVSFGSKLAQDMEESNIAADIFENADSKKVIVDGLESLTEIEQFGYAMKLIIPYLIVLISNVTIYFIAISRMLELAVRVLFAPMAVADIFHDMQRSNGFRYMKKILALSLQTAVCVGICIGASAVLQAFGGDPQDVVTELELNMLDIKDFLDDHLLGGGSYIMMLGILLARTGLTIKSLQICNDIVGV